MQSLIRWLMKRFMPGFHIAKNPVRKGKVDETQPQADPR